LLKSAFIKQRILANAYIEQEKAKEQRKKKLEMILATSGKDNDHEEEVQYDMVSLSKQKEECGLQKLVYSNPAKTVSKKRKSVDASIFNAKNYNICESNILLKRPRLHRRMIAVC